MITSTNRFQITHGSRVVFGEGAFVVFDVTGEADSLVYWDYTAAVRVRDALRNGTVVPRRLRKVA